MAALYWALVLAAVVFLFLRLFADDNAPRFTTIVVRFRMVAVGHLVVALYFVAIAWPLPLNHTGLRLSVVLAPDLPALLVAAVAKRLLLDGPPLASLVVD